METVKDQFKKLPLQKRLQAIENTRKHSSFKISEKLNHNSKNLSDAISGSFFFSETRQGHDYWMNIINKY